MMLILNGGVPPCQETSTSPHSVKDVESKEKVNPSVLGSKRETHHHDNSIMVDWREKKAGTKSLNIGEGWK